VNPQRISFARTLPILALLLSYVIIAVPATMTYIGLRHISRHGRGVSFHSHRYQFTIPPEHFLRSSITASAEVTSHYIQALNIPGFMIELPVDRSTKAWPMEWVPPGLDYTQWRAFILPICCLPFWWFAGIGIDALTTRLRQSWWVLLLGSILWVFIGVIETGLWFGISKSDRDGLIFPYVGLGIWFVLLSVFPISGVREALSRRRIRTRLQARLSAELQ
jgi:hypothetical protein